MGKGAVFNFQAPSGGDLASEVFGVLGDAGGALADDLKTAAPDLVADVIEAATPQGAATDTPNPRRSQGQVSAGFSRARAGGSTGGPGAPGSGAGSGVLGMGPVVDLASVAVVVWLLFGRK